MTYSKRRYRSYKKKAPAKGQKAQIKANSRAITKLTKQTVAYRQYRAETTHEVGTDIFCKQVMVPDDWIRVFQSRGETDEEIPRVYTITSIDLQYVFQCGNNSTGNQWLQYMVFSLKPNIRAQWIDRTNDGNSLTDNLDYTNLAMDSVDGLTDGFSAFVLNPAFFTIHMDTGMHRIGTVTMEGNDITNIENTTYYGRRKLSWKKTFKAGERRDKGFESLVAIDVNHSSRLYSILFSNASGTSPLFQSCSWNLNGQCVRS